MKQLLAVGALSLFQVCAAHAAHDHAHDAPHAQAAHAFVENEGQWRAPFLFRADLNGAALFVEKNGWTWAKLEPSASDRMHDFSELSPEERATLRFNGHAWRMRFVGAAPESAPQGLVRAGHDIHFFLGNDQRMWRSHVGAFGEVVQHAVWPGIDVVLKTVGFDLKYDVLVAPGADAARVALAYEGLEDMKVGEDGVLVLKTSVGDVTEMAPVAFYGDDAGGPIACRFDLRGATVGFVFPDGYDRSRPVVIDPVLVAGTYSGATGASNYGHCAAFDNEGNIYTAGRNFGPTYPATVGAFQTQPGGGGTDMSLSKYNPDGSELIWAAYLGGSNGENPHSLVANALGELIVLGSSNSANFPVTDGAFDPTVNGEDITVTHISADGSTLLGSTFLGGSGSDGLNQMYANYGEEYRGEVFTDALGNILIVSFTSSSDFPVTAGAVQASLGGGQDGVVSKLDPTCSQLLASTYLGGTSDDNAMGIRVAENGELFVTGSTESADLSMPTGGFLDSYQGGERDGYVLRYSADLTTIVAGTFFGTSSSDRPYFIDLDSEDNVWIYGQTDGVVPVYPAGTYGTEGGDIFLAKFSADLTDAPITTAIEGSAAPVAFLVDVCDHVYISAYNVFGALPTTADALYPSGGFYLAVFDVDMADLIYGTYYGGSHVDGGTSRFDKNGVVYQGVCSGGNSMQSTPWAYATDNQVGWDIAVFKIDFESAGVQANITTNAQNGCVPATFNLIATGQATEFIWDIGDGSPIQTGTQISVTFEETGTYVVTLIGNDPGSCNLADTTYITLNVYDPNELVAAFTPTPLSTCDGFILQVENNSIGANQYAWDFGDGTTGAGLAPSHEYDEAGTYTVVLEVTNTVCADTADIAVPVTFVVPTLPFEPASPAILCPGATAQITAGTGFDSYVWTTGGTTASITVSTVGEYGVTVTDGACEATGMIEVVAAPVPPPMEDKVFCPGGTFVLAVPYPVTSILWSNGATTPNFELEDSGSYSFIAVDGNGCTVRDTVEVITISAERGPELIPNVFTPNGDSKNDRFQVDAPGLVDFRMEVYDRWGLKMYETNNIQNGWNGGLDNRTGNAVPDGTYFYVIDFRDVCSNEGPVTRTGHLTLLR